MQQTNLVALLTGGKWRRRKLPPSSEYGSRGQSYDWDLQLHE
jgi:hypothetical protein